MKTATSHIHCCYYFPIMKFRPYYMPLLSFLYYIFCSFYIEFTKISQLPSLLEYPPQ